MTTSLSGNHPLIVTPFSEDGTIDEASLRNLVQFNLDAGAEGILALGTTGEFFSLTHPERRKIIEIVAEEVRGRVPIGIGTADTGPILAAEMGEFARNAKCDYLLIPPPFYAPTVLNSEQGIGQFFLEIASRTSLPIMVYDGGSSIEVPLSTLQNIAREKETIRAIKLNIFAPGKIGPLREAGYSVMCGTDLTMLLTLRHGADGFTTAIGGVMPAEAGRFYRLGTEGKWDEARELFQSRLLPVINVIVAGMPDYIVSCKQFLVERKIIRTAVVRNPLRKLEPLRIDEIAATARRIGLS